MKNQVKLTTKFSSVVVMVTVFAVTFFVTSAVVLAQYQGPPGNPPEGNPPGFIFNSSSQRQNAQINITGPAKVESQVIVAEGTSNEVIIGQGAIKTPQVCLPPYDAASCVSSWDGVTGGGSFWSQDSRGWIYNDGGDDPNDLGLRVYNSGKTQFHFLNDWFEVYPSFAEGTVAQGGTGSGDGDQLIVKWGDDTNDQLVFVNNLNYLSSGNDQAVLTLKRDQIVANQPLSVTGNITASGTICDGTGNCIGEGGVFVPGTGAGSATYLGRMNVTGADSIGIKLSQDKALTTLSDSNTFAITNGEIALNRLSARGTIDAHTDLCLTSAGITQCGLTVAQLQSAGLPAAMSATRPFRSSGVPQILIDEGPDKISRIELLGQNASGIVGNVGPNSRFSDINEKFALVVANPTYPGGQGIWINTADNNKFGFVGIGVTNPQARLDVAGTTFFRSNPTTGGGQAEIEAYYNESLAFPSTVAELNNSNRSSYGAIFGGGFRVNEYYDAATDTMKKTRRGPSGTIEMKEWGDWMFSVVPDAAAGANANTGRKTPLVIKNDGRIGINTSGGNWNDGTVMDSGNNGLTINAVNGNALDTYSGTTYANRPPYAYSGIRLWDNGIGWGTGNQYWGIWHRSGKDDAGVTLDNAFRINYYTGAANGSHVEAFNINPNGNTGIGVTNPVSDLHVDGQILASGLDGARMTLGNGPSNPLTSDVWVMDNYYYPSSSNYNKLFRIYRQDNLTTAQAGWQNFFLISTNGNVGLGIVPTNTSGNKLHVAGNIKANGTICDGSGNCIGAAGGSSTPGGLGYDVNADGKVDEADQTIVVNCTLGVASCTTIYRSRSDLNRDGSVNAVDVQMIINAILFNKPTWVTSGNNIYNANVGNVGIHTATPNAELHIYSGANAGEKTYPNSGEYDGLLVNTYWNTSDANYGVVDFVSGRYTNSSSGGSKIRFFTQPRTGATGAVPPQVRMEIDKDGSVGIGTATHAAVRLRTAISGQSTEAVVGTNNTQDSVAGVGDSVWGSLAQNVGGTGGYGVGVFGFSATPNGIGVQGSVTNSTGYSGYFTGGRGVYVDKLCFANGECKTSWSGGIVSACTPNCSGKECGDNGCGGTCGTCATDETCNISGICEGTDPKSDARLKNIAGRYQYGLDEVLALNPVVFSFKAGNPYNLSTKQQVGLIAQDVEPIIPEAVSYDDKGYLGLNQNSIIYAMLNAIKEQQEQIVKLQVQLDELKGTK
ncbi:MAG: tail fiber domain-containing protein [Candidatus Buchananbacteria bacterium]|nr:tail fiber domain-containing protein [Candidatus Buchananbacteria bacterium]